MAKAGPFHNNQLWRPTPCCTQAGEGRRPHTRQQTRRRGPPKLSRPQYQWRLLESSRRLYTGTLPQLLPVPEGIAAAAAGVAAQPSSVLVALQQRGQVGPTSEPAVQPLAAVQHWGEARGLAAKLKHAQELRKQLESVLSSIDSHGHVPETAPAVVVVPTREPWEMAGPKLQYPKHVLGTPDPMLLLQRHTQQRVEVLANLPGIAAGTITQGQYAMLYKQIHAHVQLLLQVSAPP